MNHQVQVITSAQGVPERCAVRGWRYEVAQVHSHWVTGSPWWITGVDVDTHTWRVTLHRPRPSSGHAAATVVDLRCSGEDGQAVRVGKES